MGNFKTYENMLGAIPNPKRSLDIDFNLEQLSNAIILIPLKNSKYKFTSKNDVLKTFRFEAYELLSLGVYIDFSISSISDTKSRVEIEVSRKIGAFDQSYEITNANEHIAKITSTLSECLILKPEDVKQLEDKNKALASNKGCGKTAAVLVGLFIGSAGLLFF